MYTMKLNGQMNLYTMGVHYDMEEEYWECLCNIGSEFTFIGNISQDVLVIACDCHVYVMVFQ